MRGPKRIRSKTPDYPPLAPGTTVRGVWIGELLIDSNGKVSEVWTIREPEITPPVAGINKAITEAVRQWAYEPAEVNKVAVPVCQTVTVNVKPPRPPSPTMRISAQ
jgi:hypothetical protein